MCTPGSVSTWLERHEFAPSRVARKYHANAIKASYSVVFCDEFHLSKGTQVSLWPHLRELFGSPTTIGISASPFLDLLDLGSIFMGTNARHFAKGPYVLEKKEHALVMDGGKITFDSAVPHYARAHIVEQSFLGRYDACNEMDKVTKKLKHSESMEQSNEVTVVTFGVAMHRNPKLKQAARVIQAWLKRRWLFADSTLQWGPNADSPPELAVDVPPHVHYDLVVPTRPADEADRSVWHQQQQENVIVRGLQTEWNMDARGTDLVKAKGVFELYHKYRVILLFPCVLRLLQTDSVAAGELGKLVSTDAKEVLDNLVNTVLWSYANHIMQELSSQDLVAMIRNLRTQRNALGFYKKIVIAADKPYNLLLTRIVLEQMILDPSDQTLTGGADFVQIDSWMKEEDVSAAVRAFVTTCPNTVGYSDTPFICLAQARKIGVGISLPPADVIIMMDMV